MRLSLFAPALAITLSACAAEVEHLANVLPACETLALEGDLAPAQCRSEAQGQMLRITYEALPQGVQLGAVLIEVLSEDGTVAQSLREAEISVYRPVFVEDIDGDGRGDIVVTRATGNANSEMAVWIFIGQEGAYRRVGQVSGFSLDRTAEGLISVSSRASAAEWNVAFFQLEPDALAPIATVTLTAARQTAGARVTWSCRLSDAPGLDRLNLASDAAEAKFCAEPIVQGERP